MLKQETIEKIRRVEGRLARGEQVKPSLRAEHIAQATWYSPRVKEARLARDVIEGLANGNGHGPQPGDEKLAVSLESCLPPALREEIARLRRQVEDVGVRVVREMLEARKKGQAE